MSDMQHGPIQKRIHKDWIEAFLTYTSFSEAPLKAHFWTAVSTISGALRRRVWMDMTYFQWTPNMYIIFVAPPGIISKSTTINNGIRLLRQLPDIRFGPDAVTWQALTESLAASTEQVPWVDKSTGEELYLPMSCITIASSEFGTFLNPSDREMVDVMVSLWDGQLGVWEKKTKTQGEDIIVNPWINMIACTTPAWIAGNFPDYMIGGGFTSRCIFVYGEEKQCLIAYPGLVTPSNLKDLERELVHDLEIISQLIGQYTLEPAAIAYGTQWYEDHYKDITNSLDSRAVGYKARKQTHIHKLAMVLAASQRDELIITEADLKKAVKIVTDLEEEMPKVFQLIGRTDGARWTEAVLDMVTKAGAIDKMALVRHLTQTLALREIYEGIGACVAAGYITEHSIEGRVVLAMTKGVPMENPYKDHLTGSDQASSNCL